MKHNSSRSISAFFNLRSLAALALFLVSTALVIIAVKPAFISNTVAPSKEADLRMRDMPTLGESPENEHRDLERLEQFWNDRLTYPTGKFNPAWVRAAADQHMKMQSAVPAGSFERLKHPDPIKIPQLVAGAKKGAMTKVDVVMKPLPLSLSTSGFTALGPSPEQMTGCSGCYDYGKTQARVNAIVVDPTTTTPGSIVAYIGIGRRRRLENNQLLHHLHHLDRHDR